MAPLTHMELNHIFYPHQFRPDGWHVDLYHVYDNLSQTPYEPTDGIWCGDPDTYWMDFWHVFSPQAIRKHLTWKNRESTQFISLYDNLDAAVKDAERRRKQTFIPGGQRRDPNSVRIAHVRIDAKSRVFAFSRAEMLSMVRVQSHIAPLEILKISHPNEWFAWEHVPASFVVNILG